VIVQLLFNLSHLQPPGDTESVPASAQVFLKIAQFIKVSGGNAKSSVALAKSSPKKNAQLAKGSAHDNKLAVVTQLEIVGESPENTLMIDDGKSRRAVVVRRKKVMSTRFVGDIQVFRPDKMIACGHCYKAVTAKGCNANLLSCYLFAVATNNLEALENHQSRKRACQAVRNQEPDVKLKCNLAYSQKKLKNPLGDELRKLPVLSNIWFLCCSEKQPISLEGADLGIIEAFALEQVIVLHKCFQVTEPKTCPGYMLGVRDRDEHEQDSVSLFDPASPTIAAWLHPIGHELESLLGWSDQVLDMTRVTIAEAILIYFHARFVCLFDNVSVGKVNKQKLRRLRTLFAAVVKASEPIVHQGQIECMRQLYHARYNYQEAAASDLKNKRTNFSRSKAMSASKKIIELNEKYDSK
jgi:hypothetical protein